MQSGDSQDKGPEDGHQLGGGRAVSRRPADSHEEEEQCVMGWNAQVAGRLLVRMVGA